MHKHYKLRYATALDASHRPVLPPLPNKLKIINNSETKRLKWDFFENMARKNNIRLKHRYLFSVIGSTYKLTYTYYY